MIVSCVKTVLWNCWLSIILIQANSWTVCTTHASNVIPMNGCSISFYYLEILDITRIGELLFNWIELIYQEGTVLYRVSLKPLILLLFLFINRVKWNKRIASPPSLSFRTKIRRTAEFVLIPFYKKRSRVNQVHEIDKTRQSFVYFLKTEQNRKLRRNFENFFILLNGKANEELKMIEYTDKGFQAILCNNNIHYQPQM